MVERIQKEQTIGSPQKRKDEKTLQKVIRKKWSEKRTAYNSSLSAHGTQQEKKKSQARTKNNKIIKNKKALSRARDIDSIMNV